MEPGELAEAARRLYMLPRAAREAMGSAGRKYYLENLSPEVQIPKYEKLFTDIINAAKGEKAGWPKSW